jgi:DNA polymerase-3 subunit epsilon
MEFVALDVETANADLASICAVGLVRFRDGKVCENLSTLVNPHDHFDEMNISIHGINPADVADAPGMDIVYPRLAAFVSSGIVVHHTHFDHSAFRKVSTKYSFPEFACRWLDSSSVARRAWAKCAKRGYGLADLAVDLAIEFKHHDATEDARCAGEILLRAIADTGIPLEDWLTLVGRPIGAEGPVAREGNPQGPLHGEVITFTGKLQIERDRAARLAAMAGCTVADSVTKKTSILVIGEQDIRLLRGHEKSTKQRKAEEMLKAGAHLRILGEVDFLMLLEHAVDVARSNVHIT